MGLKWGWGLRASWAVHGSVHGWCMALCMCGGGFDDVDDVVGWEKCMGILPGLVRLDLGLGGGLDGDG